MTPKEKAQQITERLFTAGNGEKAERLALIGSYGSELGGWGFDSVVKLIEEATTPAFIVSADQLLKIMPKLPSAKLAAYFPHLAQAMADHEINTPLRAAAFLAQLAHESGEFRYMQEIWGPTAQQKKYEPPSDLAKRLGNTEKGDGLRYRGRGVIMITGRNNYRNYGRVLGVDLEANPDLAAKPEYAFRIAALYWKLNRCSELADVGDFKAITRAINGGLTNLADREKYYEIAKKALGVSG